MSSGSVILRNATAAELAAENEVYKRGEEVYEHDTGISKIGDGSTPYNALDDEDEKLIARKGLLSNKGRLQNQRYLFELFDDFIRLRGTNNELAYVRSGTGYVIESNPVDNTDDAIGILSFGATTGYWAMYPSNAKFMFANFGKITLEVRCKMTFTPNTTDTMKFQIGTSGFSTGASDPVGGGYMEIDSAINNNWRFVTQAGVRSDTGVAMPAANTWNRFKWVFDANAGNAKFYVNEVLIHTALNADWNNFGIYQMSPFVQMLRTGGGTQYATFFDWFHLKMEYYNPR